MGRLFLELLDDDYVYCCRVCKNLLTTQANFQSDSFQGSSGKAYLFKHVSNIICSSIEEKQMTTGKHIVRDVFCKLCQSRLGWVYEMAYPTSQQYKEGQYILEYNFIERTRGVGLKEKNKDRSSSDSSPSESLFTPMRYDATATHYAVSNMQRAYDTNTFADFNRILNRAVALNYNNEMNQRVQNRHSTRLRRAHLPS
ncbi:Protein yippee-like 5 [Aphelenchoides bicaudatus]|nr:Protein yippee-like 5 [Aphelenchoides bicaudatus]